MFNLSRESENSLKRGILKLIQDFLQSYFKPKPRLLGLITQDELQTELNIKYGTVKRWEDAGLKRYMPPIEGIYRFIVFRSRKMIDDIIPELNDIQTLTAVALVDGDLDTSQAVLRVIAQKLPQLIEMLEELDNGTI